METSSTAATRNLSHMKWSLDGEGWDSNGGWRVCLHATAVCAYLDVVCTVIFWRNKNIFTCRMQDTTFLFKREIKNGLKLFSSTMSTRGAEFKFLGVRGRKSVKMFLNGLMPNLFITSTPGIVYITLQKRGLGVVFRKKGAQNIEWETYEKLL